MSIHVHWFLPTTGDSREIVGFGPTSVHRAPDIEYLAQVARAADHLGFEAVLTPTGTWCEDSWLTTAALTRETRHLKFLVAFRPGLISPTLAAQQASTFQRISHGRLLINIVTGGDAVGQRRFDRYVVKVEPLVSDGVLTLVERFFRAEDDRRGARSPAGGG